MSPRFCIIIESNSQKTFFAIFLGPVVQSPIKLIKGKSKFALYLTLKVGFATKLWPNKLMSQIYFP